MLFFLLFWRVLIRPTIDISVGVPGLMRDLRRFSAQATGRGSQGKYSRKTTVSPSALFAPTELHVFFIYYFHT